MVEVKRDFGETGKASSKAGGHPTHADALRDVADDLASGKLPACTEPAASDLTTAIALVNEIRTNINAAAAVAIKTTKG